MTPNNTKQLVPVKIALNAQEISIVPMLLSKESYINKAYFFLSVGGPGSLPVPLIVPFALSRVSVNTHFGPVSIPDRTASPSTGNLKCCGRVVERKIIKIQIYPRFAIRPIKNSLLVHHFYPRCALSCLKNRMAL